MSRRRISVRRSAPVVRDRWRAGWVTWIVAGLCLLGLGLLHYSPVASWFASYHQSRMIEAYDRVAIPPVDQRPSPQIKQAQEYNAALLAGSQTVGAVVAANTNIPQTTTTSTDESTDYNSQLSFDDSGIMARLRVPAINVDIPIYHGTSDATLLKGAGHLEGTSLPVGGPNTHAVITAHRGLANATMFTNLDKVRVGDRFTIEVAGEVLIYQVASTQVVDPDDTENLVPQAGKDLVTLVTCTPLGINTQRILVTGERVPLDDDAAIVQPGQPPQIPGFPWWAVTFTGGVGIIGVGVWWAGRQPVYVPRRLSYPLPAHA